MPTMELTDAEVKKVAFARLDADARNIAVLTGIEQHRLAHIEVLVESAKRAALKADPAADLVAVEAAKRKELADAYQAVQDEKARFAALKPDERKAEMLVKQKERLTAQMVKVDADLADPAIIAVTDTMVDGVVPAKPKVGG
jgi:multidrug resistance efflux pump